VEVVVMITEYARAAFLLIAATGVLGSAVLVMILKGSRKHFDAADYRKARL
jgi:hypothetical protein